MTPAQARQVLLLCRPGTSDLEDPEMVQALEVAGQDPALRQWYEQHCAFQTALRNKLRQIEAPAGLKARILAQRKIVPLPVWWRRPVWLAAAAAVVLFVGILAVAIQAHPQDRFANYRVRMVRAALREYAMDLKTPEDQQLRQFLAAKGAPADYVLPKGLAKLPLTGGGFLRWRNHPVSMVCFNQGGGQMLYLFVLDRSAVQDPPPATPHWTNFNKFEVASWTRDSRTYLLAGPKEPGFQSYLLEPQPN
jgi:hypothetical protein